MLPGRGALAIELTAEGFVVGLSIVQSIVSAHKGTIKIESAPKQLTVVTVRLPLVAKAKTA